MGMEGVAGCTVIEAKFAASPMPCSVAVCGLLAALSVIVRVPVLAPVAVGAKVTVTIQFTFPAIALGQALVWAKSPLVRIAERVTGVV